MIKNLVFRTEVAVKGHADLMPKTPGSLTREKNGVWGQKSKEKKVGFQPTPERAKQNLGQEDNRCLPARFYRTPLARKRKESAK